ncbi:GNAT family N-acetyltransferase [uncultured Cocleimonas sp.]|uniref:GNAT family N-acetyltransferase n=1 Tax=uncultured Cocleimonas sp. TaxID=1051587 RepID=UPI00260796AF|nr:GNAT family N-acetyltransferase [uncultured Cocleimonas sp.]
MSDFQLDITQCEKQFVELDKSKHDRTLFDCGEPQLNHFIKQQAARHMKANISRTMVLASKQLTNGTSAICAFYTITPSAISRKQLPDALVKKLPHYPIPVFLLAQLAVDKQHHGSGLGKITLIKALQHLHSVNDHMRAYAVIVDCLNGNAESFYKKFGFASLGEQNGMVRMYLPMKQLEQLFG